jgi:hypothetical protein
MTMLTAYTAYGTPILAKTLSSRKDAIAWAQDEGQRYGAARIVQKTATGPRTVWKSDARAVA